MLQFFKKWCESLDDCLRHGDLQTISAKTGLSYHQVRRIMKGESKTEGSERDPDKEKTLRAANAIIHMRALEEQLLTDAFNHELILEKQKLAEKAMEEVQQLSGEKEDF
jgi:hypothetical protein